MVGLDVFSKDAHIALAVTNCLRIAHLHLILNPHGAHGVHNHVIASTSRTQLLLVAWSYYVSGVWHYCLDFQWEMR